MLPLKRRFFKGGLAFVTQFLQGGDDFLLYPLGGIDPVARLHQCLNGSRAIDIEQRPYCRDSGRNIGILQEDFLDHGYRIDVADASERTQVRLANVGILFFRKSGFDALGVLVTAGSLEPVSSSLSNPEVGRITQQLGVDVDGIFCPLMASQGFDKSIAVLDGIFSQ